MDTLYQSQQSAAPLIQAPPNSMNKFQGTMVILLLCVGLAILGWFTFEVSAGFDERIQTGITRVAAIEDKINAPIQWEYKIESLPDRSFDQRINAMGKDGWELVFARRASDGSDYSPTFSYEMIFKRPRRVETETASKNAPKKDK
jgi:hypothetical protein